MHHFRPILHIGWGAPLSFLHHCPINRVCHPHPLCPLSTIPFSSLLCSILLSKHLYSSSFAPISTASANFHSRLLHPYSSTVIVTLILSIYIAMHHFSLSFLPFTSSSRKLHSHLLQSPYHAALFSLICTTHQIWRHFSDSFAKSYTSTQSFLPRFNCTTT